MSAYIVNRAHIAALVETALHGATDAEKGDTTDRFNCDAWDKGADALGQMLLDANVTSIEARYPDTVGHPEEMPGTVGEPADAPYVHPLTARRLTIAEAFKAINGYEYQTCEFHGWEVSHAYAFCDGLRRHLCREVPGYHAAAWNIEDAKATA